MLTGNRSEYSRYYGDFRGVDFSSDHTLVADSRFPYLANMYKDYASGGGQGIETIPGFRRRFVAPNGGRIHGMHSYKDKAGKRHVLVHAGDHLYKWGSYPQDAGYAKEIVAVAKEYDEYTSNIEGVGIATDYVQIEFRVYRSFESTLFDVRSVGFIDSQMRISIYPENIDGTTAENFVYAPDAYTFYHKVYDVDDRYSIVTVKISKQIKGADGAVYRTIAVGDTINVECYTLDQRDDKGSWSGKTVAPTLTEVGTSDTGARIIRLTYGQSGSAASVSYLPIRYGWSSSWYTDISNDSIPPFENIPGVVSQAKKIPAIRRSNGSKLDVFSISRWGGTGGIPSVVVLYDGVEELKSIPFNGESFYQLDADGEKIYLPAEAGARIDYQYVWYYDYETSVTATEFDEYAAEGKTDYTCIDVSEGGNLDISHVYLDGASEIPADKYRREGSLLLFSKQDLEIGKRVNVLFGEATTESLSGEMNEHDSTSFVFGDKLYILDGKNYLVYDGTEVAPVMDNAYIPTTYINIVVGGENADAGAEYEARNMLSPYFKHTFIADGQTKMYYMNEKALDSVIEVKVWGQVLTEGEDYEVDLADGKIEFTLPPEPYSPQISSPEQITGTEGLEYKQKANSVYYECTGKGTASGDEIIVGNHYDGKRVVGIATRAFFNLYEGATKVVVADGITSIGGAAFEAAYAVKSIELPDSLTSIGFMAFAYAGIRSITIPRYVTEIPMWTFLRAQNLESVKFNGVPATIAPDAFTGCNSLKKIEVAWKKDVIPGAPWGAPENVEIIYGTETSATPIAYPTESAGVEIIAEKGLYPAIDGNGEMSVSEFRSLIEQATIATVFDNRVFFSGIPARPNFLFWSSLKNPSYIGILNYQQDGIGTTPITAMVPVANTLLVLKSDTEDGGAVFYHTPVESGIDVMAKSYPSEEGLAGIGCLGAACNFLDDPVFISRLGLEAVGKLNLSYERSKEHRSSLIDAKLVNLKDLASAKLCEWSGYLVLLVDGKIFLADSRQRYADSTGIAQYEWYYLEDIGVYQGQYKRYEYLREYPRLLMDGDTRREVTVTYAEREYTAKLISDVLPDVDITEVDPKIDKVIAQVDVDGIRFEIVAAMYELNGTYHACLCTTADEMVGGTFCPAVVVKTTDENLFFGTTNGVICSFNFDKRGSDGAIPADYYTFDGRRIYSGCALKMDNCGVPHMTKTTVKKSTVVKAKSFMRTAAKIRVRTNKNPFNEIARITGTRFSFDDMDFSDFSFVVGEDTLFAIREKEKKWVEKQYYVYSDEYKKPFALYYLAYKYFVAGKYKG